MKIGIDIDDTLTDIKEQLNIAACDYASKLNKNIDLSEKNFEDTTNDGSAYQKKYGFNYEELKYFLGPIQENITDNALPRKNAANVIKKLKSEGHEIYIITARDSEIHKDPYSQSKTWLLKHDIIYDKLIVNASNKALICKNEKVDILIDDKLHNCLSVLDAGINAIRISKEKSPDVPSFNDWNDIYDYIVSFSKNKL